MLNREPRQVKTAAALQVSYRPFRNRMLIAMRTMILIIALRRVNIVDLLSSFDQLRAPGEISGPRCLVEAPKASSSTAPPWLSIRQN
jgi:hypothetical protein